MTTPKLPEAAGKVAYEARAYEQGWISSEDAYTASQVREILEIAAKGCIDAIEEHKLHSNNICAMVVRALKEQL